MTTYFFLVQLRDITVLKKRTLRAEVSPVHSFWRLESRLRGLSVE